MLCEKEKCTGCFACYNICPKNAIEMKEDELGYIYPNINKKNCIDCKLCEKVCPTLNESEFKAPQKCYAAKVNDDEKLKKSTSGGIATALSEEIIRNNGIVYGAAYLDNCEVNHIRVTELEELDKLKGSKYVHSYVQNTYQLVKEDLLKNNEVLFIGTPCQIDGLRKYLMKEYENLYLVDLICHGVPSQKFLKEEVYRCANTLDIDRVNFRDKTFSDFTFSINKNKKDIYSQIWIKNPYFYAFMKSITYRENCYLCQYAKKERISDITIGDFWGLKEDSNFYKERKKGLSVILPITDKGLRLLNRVEKMIIVEERTIKEAIDGNDQLRTPAIKSKDRKKFISYYADNKSFFKSYKKACKNNYYKQIIKSNKFVKKILELRKEVKNGKK